MKKIIAVFAPLFMTLASCAQDIPQSLVPSVVINAFQQQFPKATDLEWEKKGELYEAEFDLAFKDHKVILDANGKVLKHKQDIAVADLPAAVKESIKKGFPHYNIDDAKKIDSEGVIVYKVEVEKRLEICAGNENTPKCEYYNNGNCGKCGCSLSLKVRMETAHCPIGKW